MSTLEQGQAVAPVSWTLGDRFRKVRHNILGATQDEMAELLSVSGSLYRQWEADRRYLAPDELVRVARIMEKLAQKAGYLAPVAWVIGITDNPGQITGGYSRARSRVGMAA